MHAHITKNIDYKSSLSSKLIRQERMRNVVALYIYGGVEL